MKLHPVVTKYFDEINLNLNSFQIDLVESIEKLENLLIFAPTGIGKTLGASTIIINEIIDMVTDLQYSTKKKTNLPLALWISPLKALSRNLMQQLKEIWDPLLEKNEILNSLISSITTDRTGDTTQADRQLIIKNPPLILCTTPESFFSMVVQKGTRKFIQRVKFVIVDELHSLAESKRGVLLSLTLELLERITIYDKIYRIGLSATVENVSWISRFLVGPNRSLNIFNDVKFNKLPELNIMVETRNQNKLLPNTGYLGAWLSEKIAREVVSDRSILIFTKTRSGSESTAFALKKIVNEDLKLRIGVHHSSLSQEERFFTENGLKHGYLKAVCCTSTLELGIDIGHIDEVILLSSPISTNSALQRLGRARHRPDEISIGKIYVVNFFDLLVSISLKKTMLRGQLSPVTPIEKPLEVLAQFIFGLALQKPFSKKELTKLLSNTLLFHSITEKELDKVLVYCTQGGDSLHAYDDFKRMKNEDGKYTIISTSFKRLFYQNIGTIVEEDMVPVYSERGWRIGELEENLASNLMMGDLISISGKIYKLTGYRKNHLVVKRDKGQGQPTIPRWGRERLSLSDEVFESLAELYREIHNLGGKVNNLLTDDEKIVYQIETVYELQIASAPWPTPDKLQIEFYDLKEIKKRISSITKIKITHPYLVILHTFAGYKQNQTIARLIGFRLQKLNIFQVRIHADEVAFGLFSYKPFPKNKNVWLNLLNNENMNDLNHVVENSNALRIAFQKTAVIGQMVLRTYYKTKKSGKQLRLSHDLLFDVLMKYEPHHPLLDAARQQVKLQFLNIPKTLLWFENFSKNKEINFLPELGKLPILSLPVIAHGWIDWSVPDNPESLINDYIEKALELEFSD